MTLTINEWNVVFSPCHARARGCGAGAGAGDVDGVGDDAEMGAVVSTRQSPTGCLEALVVRPCQVNPA